MRLAALAFVGAVSFGLSALPVNASPFIPHSGSDQVSNILPAAGGCRRGYQPNRWGHCASSRYGYSHSSRYARGILVTDIIAMGGARPLTTRPII
jgi:hypothetical protein